MNNKEMGRRSFLKKLGAATAVASGASLYSCSSEDKQAVSVTSSKAGQGEMTYRTHPTNGDKVSILGYGCMRWPRVRILWIRKR